MARVGFRLHPNKLSPNEHVSSAPVQNFRPSKMVVLITVDGEIYLLGALCTGWVLSSLLRCCRRAGFWGGAVRGSANEVDLSILNKFSAVRLSVISTLIHCPRSAAKIALTLGVPPATPTTRRMRFKDVGSIPITLFMSDDLMS